jgi:hypothetical protein
VAQPTGSDPIPAHVFADPSIVDRITTGVDVAGQHTASAGVSDNIDEFRPSSDDRGVQ